MASPGNPEALLELLASLTERDSTLLQIKINKYLSRAVAARLAFLAIVSPDEEDLMVHVLGDSCLPARLKIAVNTPCFERALSTKKPTTLKHLDAQQLEDLFKVLQLLHSPAHLAASGQTSRSLSTGAACGVPLSGLSISGCSVVGGTGVASREGIGASGTGVASSEDIGASPIPVKSEAGSINSGSISGTTERPSQSSCSTATSTADVARIIPSSISSNSELTGTIGERSGGDQLQQQQETKKPHSTSDEDPSSSLPLSREALIADNVFVSSSPPISTLASAVSGLRGKGQKLSLSEKPSSSFNIRYIEPESFLCVPLLNPDLSPRQEDDEIDGYNQRNEDDGSPCTVLLACFIDKLDTSRAQNEKGSKRLKNDSDPDTQAELERTSSSSSERNEPLDFRRSTTDLDFDDRDVECIQQCFRYTLPLLLRTLAHEAEKRQRSNCQKMLDVARKLFARLEDVSLLLQEIMSKARSLTDAERCSLFLLDNDKKELVAKVFDGETNDGNSANEVRLPTTAGIAGHVATTGKLLNIRDAYANPLFFQGFDQKTGFRTRSLLCFPIKAGEPQHVIGVAELCNKTTGRFFTQYDEQLATSFSVFCGIAITHSLLYNKVSDAHARIKLSNELMMLHMNVTREEVERLTNMEVPKPSALHPDFFSFSFFPRVLPEASTPLAVVSMMTHLGIPQRWSIPPQTLARFVLMVRKGYRDPPYHNWVHAFSVTHFAFLLIHNLGLCDTGAISHMEALALMISCLCHDLDHRGTTNSFQVDSNSVLASLYSSEGSVMERHHLAQAMCILNTESCNILENLSKDEYTQCLDLMRDIILATDLAHHLRLLGELKKMSEDGYDSENQRHRHLVICLLMTSADLSDQTKDWYASRQVAKLIYKEFFTQGDLEKAMGNNPLVMMDREKAFIPELQLSFLDNIALPVYKLVADIFPGASAPYESVLESKRRWTHVKDTLEHCKGTFASSLEIFDTNLGDCPEDCQSCDKTE